MPLDKLVSSQFLRLSVMQPSEAEIAVQIRKKADDDWHMLGSETYDRMVLPGLIESFRKRLVIVGKVVGEMVAVYEPPAFGIDHDGAVILGKGKYVDALGSQSYALGNLDFFAVSEEKAGIGTAFFTHFEKVLGEVAFVSRVPIIHRVLSTHRSQPFYEKVGYRPVCFIRGLRSDYVIMERICQPVEQKLPDGEMHIVQGLQRSVSVLNKLFK